MLDRRTALSGLATALLLLVLGWAVFAAVRADGFARTDLFLNDGGAWLVNQERGDLAHVNGEVFEVDARIDVGTGGVGVDVVQAPGFVFAQLNGGLVPVDTARLQLTDVLIGLPSGVDVDAGQGIVGVFDRQGGRVWRMPIGELDESVQLDELPPTFSFNRPIHAVVGLDGAVHLAGNSLISIDGEGGEREFDLESDLDALTAIGERAVGISGDDLVDFSGLTGVAVPLDRRLLNPTLQQPGRFSDVVFAVTENGEVVEIDRSNGRVIVLEDNLGSRLLPPVAHRGCVFTYAIDLNETVRICGGERVAWPVVSQPAEPRLRLVNDRVWLDDPATDLYAYVPLEGDQVLVENWPDRLGAGIGDTGVGDGADDDELGPASASEGDGVGGLGRGQVFDDGINEPPIARDDQATVVVGRSGIVSVLANDLEPDGDVLGVILEDPPDGVALLSDQRIFIEPQSGPTTISVSYRASDGLALSNLAVLRVTIEDKNGNTAPTAVDDFATATVGAPLLFDVLYNDRDDEGDALVLSSLQIDEDEPVVASFTSDGLVTVTALSSGETEIEYTVSDGAQTADATLIISAVAPGEDNRSPEAINDFVSTLVDVPIAFEPLINDSDPDGDPLEILELGVVEPADSASFELLADSSVVMSPAPGFLGAVEVPYVVIDRAGGEDSGLIRVEVTERSSANRPPILVDDSVLLRPGASAVVTVLANDFDPDGDVIGVVSASSDDDQLSVVVVDRGSVEVSASGDASGTGVVQYVVDDGRGLQSTGVVTVLISERENVPPIAELDLGQVEVGSSTVLDVLANDFDPDGDELSIVAVGEPEIGSLVLRADQLVEAVAGPDDAGTITATYTVEDADGARADGTVSVVIVSSEVPNKAPIARDDSSLTTVGEPAFIDVLANDVDPENGDLRVVDVTQPESGGRTEITSAGAIRLVPAFEFTGELRFSYTIADPEGELDSADVRVRVDEVPVENRPPRAVDDRASTRAGQPVTIAVVVNDTDPDPGDRVNLEVRSVNDARVSIDGAGRSVVFSPEEDDVGLESFDYTVADGRGGTDLGTVIVNVQPMDLPTCSAPIPATMTFPVDVGETVVVDVVSPSTYDCDKANLVVASEDTRVEVDGNTLTFTAGEAAGIETIVYTLSDEEFTATATVRFKVAADTEVPPPVARPDSFEVASGQRLRIPLTALLGNDEGIDLSVVSIAEVTNGVATLLGNRVEFVADDVTDTGSFDYTIVDVEGQEASTTVTIGIEGNRPPKTTSAAFDLEVDEVIEVLFDDYATDPDDDELTYDIGRSSGPIAVNSIPGGLSIEGTGDGEGTVSWSATDGTDTTAGRFDVTVVEPCSALAVADSVTVMAGDSITIDVLENDVGESPEVLSVRLVSGSGTPTVNAAGNAIVFIAPSAEGSTILRYRMSTECGNSSASVSVTIDDDSAPPPEISALRTSSIGDTEATVGFTTNVCATARYDYVADDGSDSGAHIAIGYPDANVDCWTDHAALLGVWTSALIPDTSYTVTVKVIDKDGNTDTATIRFQTTGSVTNQPVWTTPPRITLVTCTSVTLDFDTPENTSELITWTPADAGGSANQGFPRSNHSTTISGLSPDTNYTFNVTATAADGTEYGPTVVVQSTNATGCGGGGGDPTCTALTWIEQPVQTATSQTSVTMRFQASEPTTHQMSWTPAHAGGGANQGVLYGQHTHQISGLVAGTSYTGSITLTNDCGESLTGSLSFATTGVPVCNSFGFTAGLAANGVGQNSATMTAQVSSPSVFNISWGPAGGSDSVTNQGASLNYQLSSLAPATTYSVTVVATSTDGNSCSASTSVQFTTAAAPITTTTTSTSTTTSVDPSTTVPTTTPTTTPPPTTTLDPGTTVPTAGNIVTPGSSSDPLDASVPLGAVVLATMLGVGARKRFGTDLANPHDHNQSNDD